MACWIRRPTWKKTSLNLKDKLFSDLLLGFQALLLVKVLASKLVTHLRDIMIAAWYDWQLWLQRPRYKAQKQILWTRSIVVLCWCSDQPTSKQKRLDIDQPPKRVEFSDPLNDVRGLLDGHGIFNQKREKNKNIEQTKPINPPTNPKDNKILPFERCPRPSYWAPPVPQTPRSPLRLRSSCLPLPVKGLFTHFTHLERNFLSHSIYLLNMVLKLIENTICKQVRWGI